MRNTPDFRCAAATTAYLSVTHTSSPANTAVGQISRPVTESVADRSVTVVAKFYAQVSLSLSFSLSLSLSLSLSREQVNSAITESGTDLPVFVAGK